MYVYQTWIQLSFIEKHQGSDIIKEEISPVTSQ